ncbi:M3 family oligoendopeptidase [Carnobacteriaceae bacterium zg-ZUI252]|nr:M3 family oligoendopeptidase [Carnobacteriaceae bacterium zg-ZUI252]
MDGKWSLTDLYTSYESTAYQNDFKALLSTLEQLEKVELKDDLETIKAVIALLEERTVLASKLFSFCTLQMAVDTTDARSLAEYGKLNKVMSANAKTDAKINRFIGNVKTDISGDDVLKEYAFYFKEQKDVVAHLLSDEVEEVIATMNMSAGSAWEQQQEYLTSTVVGEFDGKEVTLSDIRNLAYHPDADVRKRAYEKELEMYTHIKEPVAFSLNHIKSQVNDVTRLRGYDSALAQTLHRSRMSQETLDALLSAIVDALPSFQRYLKHKGTLLGHQNGLPFYDLFAPIGQGASRTFSVEESKVYLMEQFGKFSKDLADMTEEFYDKNYIDIFPRKGKRGGAFCYNLPVINQSRVMTNFDGSLSSVVTMAHELGHAYHGVQIENHRPLNWDYTMPVAETASTFNENIVMQNVISQASDAEKIGLIESQLQDLTQIIVDIYSRYLFEKSVFEERAEKFLFAADLEKLMMDAQQKAYGDGLDANALHPYMWVCKPHYYSESLSYYNFPYAFGGLFAKGLYALYLEQSEGFVEKYKAMLTATTVSTVEETAQFMGVDITKKEFWAKALHLIEQQIEDFVSLTQ